MTPTADLEQAIAHVCKHTGARSVLIKRGTDCPLSRAEIMALDGVAVCEDFDAPFVEIRPIYEAIPA